MNAWTKLAFTPMRVASGRGRADCQAGAAWTWFVTALAILLIVLSSSASGAKPERTPEEPRVNDFPEGEACPSFAVRIQTETRGSVKVFANGEIQWTGYERAWVTNMDSGKQIELIVNGRSRVTLANGGEGELVTTGPQIIVFWAGDKGPGNELEFRTYYFKGHTSAIIDDYWTFLDFEFSGKSMDLCAALS